MQVKAGWWWWRQKGKQKWSDTWRVQWSMIMSRHLCTGHWTRLGNSWPGLQLHVRHNAKCGAVWWCLFQSSVLSPRCCLDCPAGAGSGTPSALSALSIHACTLDNPSTSPCPIQSRLYTSKTWTRVKLISLPSDYRQKINIKIKIQNLPKRPLLASLEISGLPLSIRHTTKVWSRVAR